ncbi:MAG: DNA-3-methyladenine glycosylase [Candidatus Saccharimonadales bacterium]
MSSYFRKILSDTAEVVAPRLLGSYLVRELNGHKLVGKIIETEAYDQIDAASHSYHGQTPRTDVMFGAPGYLYVYFTYGMHYCCNVVTGRPGEGSAVLIRALVPLEGVETMSKNRHGVSEMNLTNGPAKLCQAFEINKDLNGHDLSLPPLQLVIKPRLIKSSIVQTTRIGIRQAKDTPWRFYLKNSPYVSRNG